MEKTVRQRKILECFLESIITHLFNQGPVHGTVVLKTKISSFLIALISLWVLRQCPVLTKKHPVMYFTEPEHHITGSGLTYLWIQFPDNPHMQMHIHNIHNIYFWFLCQRWRCLRTLSRQWLCDDTTATIFRSEVWYDALCDEKRLRFLQRHWVVDIFSSSSVTGGLLVLNFAEVVLDIRFRILRVRSSLKNEFRFLRYFTNVCGYTSTRRLHLPSVS
jgi:hypothetical protein